MNSFMQLIPKGQAGFDSLSPSYSSKQPSPQHCLPSHVPLGRSPERDRPLSGPREGYFGRRHLHGPLGPTRRAPLACRRVEETQEVTDEGQGSTWPFRLGYLASTLGTKTTLCLPEGRRSIQPREQAVPKPSAPQASSASPGALARVLADCYTLHNVFRGRAAGAAGMGGWGLPRGIVVASCSGCYIPQKQQQC